jgi:hypothetical protein
MNKKAQEEIVGFVVVVVLVVIALVIILGLFLNFNKYEQNLESLEIRQFLESYSVVSSECSQEYEPLTMENLIIACKNEEFCDENKNSCEILEYETSFMLNESFKIGKDAYIKSYEFSVTEENKKFIELKAGSNCSDSVYGSEYPIIRSDGSFYIKLQLCN